MKTFVQLLILFSVCFFQSCAADRALRLVILPDTQSYLESCPEIMEAQFKWLAEQEADVDYVLHVGDITQDNTHAEWALAATYFDLIHDRIPYAISLGNHDFGSAPGKYADVRDSQLANKYFPLLPDSNGIVSYEVKGLEGVPIESEQFDGQDVRIVLIPNPARFVMHINGVSLKDLWRSR